jgi:hypothetical protein
VFLYDVSFHIQMYYVGSPENLDTRVDVLVPSRGADNISMVRCILAIAGLYSANSICGK